jgi:hypothetical protein
MREVIFHLPFGNGEAVREVTGGTTRAGDRMYDLLSDRRLWAHQTAVISA